LSYQPFVSQINEDQIQYLNKVAEMMTDKETLELHVCGFASDAEVKALAEQPAKVVLHNVSNWRQLAQKRSGNIKAWFKVQHQELLPRVTTCQPQKGEEAVVSMGF
jgi:methionine synthase II (cobalamin-independent)